MTAPLDPNLPPHKTKRFWALVAVVGAFCVAYSFMQPPQGLTRIDPEIWIVTFLVGVACVWFGVRRAQRGRTGPSGFTLLMIVLAIIFSFWRRFLRIISDYFVHDA